MQSDHGARVKEIFTGALDQSSGAREAFAREARGADGRVKRIVSVKFLSPAALPDPAGHQRFVRKARAAGRGELARD
ncbi:MAG: hypothetical protein ABSG26_06515 [Bryobacteraceae bacterium]|jgi:hypothetical protein